MNTIAFVLSYIAGGAACRHNAVKDARADTVEAEDEVAPVAALDRVAAEDMAIIGE